MKAQLTLMAAPQFLPPSRHPPASAIHLASAIHGGRDALNVAIDETEERRCRDLVAKPIVVASATSNFSFTRNDA